jgi:undecaprenyl-diphosphatase
LTYLESILLGIVQGFTELIPVSSSGHLVIAQSLMPGFQQPGVLFDVVLHLGTLLSVLVFFRRDIIDILLALIPKKCYNFNIINSELILQRKQIALLIIVATVLTGSIGLLFKDRIHALFQSVEVTASMLLITGLLLLLSDRVKNTNRQEKDMTFMDGVVLGLVQGVALIPGISRSGTTIAFGIFRKLDRETAAKFSFLLSIPAILGASILESRYAFSISEQDIIVYACGFLTASVTGFLSLKLLFWVIKNMKLSIFGYYCWFVGITTLIVKNFFL